MGKGPMCTAGFYDFIASLPEEFLWNAKKPGVYSGPFLSNTECEGSTNQDKFK
jgi:hypothetical protein